MPYSARTKDPNSVELYTLDWTPHLGSGESITASTWTPPGDASITVVDEDFTGTSSTLKLSGGTNGREYSFTNHVVTAEGEYDWDFIVSVYENVSVPLGPPYATRAEAEGYHEKAEGFAPIQVDTVLRRASEIVARLAPRPSAPTAVLPETMDASQSTIPVPLVEDWPDRGQVQIESEVISYSLRSTESGLPAGVGTLDNALRGRHATTPASHASGVTITDVTYALAARDAELMVFAWLWDTRAYVPARSGVIGSESYSIDPGSLKVIVRQAMGDFYKGGSRTQMVPINSIHQTDRWDRRYPSPGWVRYG